MLTFRKFLLEYATLSPESKRKGNEDDETYQDRLFNNPVIQEEFRRYLIEDCLRSLESIKHLNNKHVNNVINLIEKWLSDPKSVTTQQFASVARAADAARAAAVDSDAVWTSASSAAWAANTVANAAAWAADAANAAADAANAAAWAANAAAWAANVVDPDINWDKIKENKIQEYVRVAKILDSQHTNDKHDRKNEIIDAINQKQDHLIRVLLNDYIQEKETEISPEKGVFARFKKYIEELHGLENISVEQFMDLLIANKPELLLFVRKYM